MSDSKEKARELARRCVERPYNTGTVERAAAIIAAALDEAAREAAEAMRERAATTMLSYGYDEFVSVIRALPIPAPAEQHQEADCD